jgi:pyruvate/2-oxoglutarate dehydrogenase complex dihydrolipoamide dehydrogenase (E3) component
VKHDLIVLGSGPVAVAAAAEGARLGLSTVLAGGAITSEPSRLAPLLASRWAASRGLGKRGRRPLAQSRWLRLQKRIRAGEHAYLAALETEIGESGVRIAPGPAKICGAGAVETPGGLLRADSIVLVVQAEPRRPPRFAYDDVTIFDAATILRAGRFPRSLVVVGASEEGCEVASLFAELGASVLLLDRRTRLLRGVDRDLLRQIHAALQQAGVEVVLEENISDMTSHAGAREPHVRISLGSGRSETFEAAVICAGWTPRLETMAVGRSTLGVDPRGFPTTDDCGRTSREGVYAVGDVSGMSLDLGVQIHAARATVRRVARLETLGVEFLPTTVHTIPEAAFAGLSEEACQRLGTPHVVGLAPLSSARLDGGSGSAGLLKLIAHGESRELLGIHAVGPAAAETLYAAAAMVQAGVTVDALTEKLFPVESAAESLRLAAWRAIAQLPARVGVPGAPVPDSLF